MSDVESYKGKLIPVDCGELSLDEKIQGLTASYAVTLHKGKTLCDEGLDEEFHAFIEFLAEGTK